MPALTLLLVLAVVVMLSAGQVLFKLTADRMPASAPIWRVIEQPALYLALAIYGAATVLWVMALRQTALTIAYPLVALSFVLVPLAGRIFFRELVDWPYWVGVILIVTGIGVIQLTQR